MPIDGMPNATNVLVASVTLQDLLNVGRIQGRTGDDPLWITVLIGESYLNELEAAAKRLRDIESGKANPGSDFKLIGSGRITDGVDDPLAGIRRDANALWEKKLASFGK